MYSNMFSSHNNYRFISNVEKAWCNRVNMLMVVDGVLSFANVTMWIYLQYYKKRGNN